MPNIIRLGGGGVELGFRIVNAASLPGAVTNGNLVIISSTPIGDWQIGAGVLPSYKSDGTGALANGDVCIVIGTSSVGAFNALTTGKIMVYPLAAYQHNGSTWVEKPAYIGRSGSWIDFAHIFLLQNGIALVSATEYEADGGVVTQGAGGCTIVKTGGASGGAYIDLPINFTGVNTVSVRYKTNSYTSAPRLLAMSESSGDTALANVTLTSGVEAVASLDVSAISGTGRVRVGYWGDTGVWNMIAYDIYYK